MRSAVNAVLILTLVALASGIAQAPASPQGGPCYVYPASPTQAQTIVCQNGSLAQMGVVINNVGTPQMSYDGGAVTFWKPNPGGGATVTAFGTNHVFVDSKEGQTVNVPYMKPNGQGGTLVYTRGVLTAIW
jgi:hypothetical protein